jgi:hypothetical protein
MLTHIPSAVRVPVREWQAPQKAEAIASPRSMCSGVAATLRLGAGARRARLQPIYPHKRDEAEQAKGGRAKSAKACGSPFQKTHL